mmetsp:Transcript_13862/g.21419  ORF Transcript_13862/g.21419 Transcript_13862/m.21419 type:complete len:416 (+) Transcript_13862:245-1492(+)|eukprot:CAMPEP_0194221852 /NCGR_PEP_ID=MMETSP0156-20130528/31515_1 /TAXON_ID=33649 /ORGANISM="Thalassionema nitzschioides, Strain L26-B" /LENGTH=415 /DNA_ID=CAMNT_0038952403 /DNA_START=203 /DNA_END=1450 /DNA_ORIENTATION=-
MKIAKLLYIPVSFLLLTIRVAAFSPLSLSIEELTESLGGKIGRARAAWDCYRLGVDPQIFYGQEPDASIDASVTIRFPLIQESSSRKDIYKLLPSRRRNQGLGVPAVKNLALLTPGGIEESIGTISHLTRAKDGTTKLLIKLAADGLEVETVIIPWKERSTVCISSQVGCRQGCTFCATGRMGRLRSLTVDEILVQVFLAQKVCRVIDIVPVDGVVFMGMGEPADNAESVVKVAEVLSNGETGFGLRQTKITISTVGPTPEAFSILGKAPAALAWSVHASKDELRKKLVPTTKFSMTELRKGYLDALSQRPTKLRTSMIEVALIGGINDSPDDAEHLADFVLQIMKDVQGAKIIINIIPFNNIPGSHFGKPSDDALLEFLNTLRIKGVKSRIRQTRGDDESAACGQLATKKQLSA